jgi:hypothetical protein
MSEGIFYIFLSMFWEPDIYVYFENPVGSLTTAGDFE